MKKAVIHISALFSMLFWGFSYVWSKIVFDYYTPLTTILFRLIISFATLFLLMALTGQFQVVKKKHVWLFLLSAIFNPFLYFLFESYGLQRVSASVSAFIIATIPVFTPVVAFWVLHERLSKVNIAGLIISFFGVLMIVITPQLEFVASPLGITFLFLGVFSAVVYGIFLKKLTQLYKPMTIIAWQNLIGVFYFIPIVWYFDFPDFLEVVPSNKALISLVLLGVFASSFAYALFAFVVKNLGISKANIYSNLIAVFAALASFFVLHEKFPAYKLSGMTVVIVGVILSQLEVKSILKRRLQKKM